MKHYEFNPVEIESIRNTLNKLASTTSRKEKEVILKCAETPFLKSFLELALNPYNNFYNIIENLIDKSHGTVSCCTLNTLLNKVFNGDINLRTDDGIDKFSRLYYSLVDDDSRYLAKCIFEKDLHCGLGAKTINKVFDKLIPIVPYMRCSLPKQVPLETLPWKEGVISQEKADGMFVNINYSDDGLTLCSRQGTQFNLDNLFGKHPYEYGRLLSRLVPKGNQTHGEMLVLKYEDEAFKVLPREEGNGLLNSVLQGSEMPEEHFVRFVLWDTIPLENAETATEYKELYVNRFRGLVRNYYDNLKDLALTNLSSDEEFLFSIVGIVKIIPTKVVYSFEEAQQHYREMLSKGKEGTVLKTKRGVWKNTTSKDQVKLKLVVDCDLEVVDLEPGKGKFASTFGSMKCKTSDGLLEVSISGFDDVTRQIFFDNKKDIIGKIVTVRFNNVMKPKEDGEKASLFLPRYVELRDDKDTADTLQQVIDAQSSAIASA